MFLLLDRSGYPRTLLNLYSIRQWVADKGLDNGFVSDYGRYRAEQRECYRPRQRMKDSIIESRQSFSHNNKGLTRTIDITRTKLPN